MCERREGKRKKKNSNIRGRKGGKKNKKKKTMEAVVLGFAATATALV